MRCRALLGLLLRQRARRVQVAGFFAQIVVAAASRSRPAPSLVTPREPARSEAALVGRVGAPLHGLAVGPGDVGGLAALVSDYDVKLDRLTFADAAQHLLRVVACDGGLVDEDVLVGVVAVDEAVAILDVEPLDGAQNPLGDYGLLLGAATNVVAHCHVCDDLRKRPGADHSC